MNVRSDGMGSWGYDVIKPLLARTFPHTEITYDDTKPPTLVVKSHFKNQETILYDCPYITWSGEAYRVRHNKAEPILEINTVQDVAERSIWLPYLVVVHETVQRPEPILAKEWCCSFAYTNRVGPREQLFRRLRSLEPSCYSFGASCRTTDNPFTPPSSSWNNNHLLFNKFGFNVAMENCVAPGYMTEKIGFAFRSGSVPIYWGSPCAKEFFNPDSFLDVGDFASPDAAADYAVELWKDSHKLQKYLDAPIRVNTLLADYEAVRTEYRPWQQPFLTWMHEAFPDLH